MDSLKNYEVDDANPTVVNAGDSVRRPLRIKRMATVLPALPEKEDAGDDEEAVSRVNANMCEDEEEGADGRDTKRRKGMQLGHARSAVIHATRGITRDSAHWCYFCKHVFWSGPATEIYEKGGPSFCTLCGSKLLPGARDAGSYSQFAQTSDDELLSKMEKEARIVGTDAVEKLKHPGVGLPALRQLVAARPKTCSPLASRIQSSKSSNSKFCDICGHAGHASAGMPNLHCSRCPGTNFTCITGTKVQILTQKAVLGSFHKTCIGLPPNFLLPKTGWWCSGCIHEAIRVREIDPLPLLPRDHRTNREILETFACLPG